MADTVIDIAGNVRTAQQDPGTGRQPGAAGAKPQGAGVRAQHRDYQRMSAKWQMCRDVSTGEEAVHDAAERYVSKLKDQTNDEYAAMVKRTPFYNATWRTIAGLNGMLFRKPPQIEAPAAVSPLLDDVTLSGMSLHILAQKVGEECLTLGRCGVFVDYPVTPVTALTKADTLPLNLRPTLTLYRAEAIINWRTRVIANASVLSMVVLKEEEATYLDAFTEVQEDRYRVLDLDDSGAYRVRRFKIDKSGRDQQIGGEVYPMLNGQRLNFIPFAFIGPDDTTPEVDDPPLIDLVEMNIHHYKVSVDYEHGCHFTGLPTPWVAGYRKDTPNERLYIGSTTAWVFPDPTTTVGYLSFGGEGMATLEKNLAAKEQQMAVLGARMLEPQIRGVEAAETASIHRTGEQSVLSAVAQSISIGLTRALQWFSDWAGGKGTASIALNRDFYPVPMTAQMLAGLISAWQQGAISFDTLFDNLKQGEIFPPDRTVEDEQAAIDTAPPLSLIGQQLGLESQQAMLAGGFGAGAGGPGAVDQGGPGKGGTQ